MNEFQSLLGELVEKVKPSIYVETGFMTGESAKAVVAAMNKNGKGEAYSIEPFFKPTFTDDRLKFTWGYSYDKMLDVFLESGGWDLFLHDSNHDVGCMAFELELAWHFTNPGGIIACDDYTWGTPPHNAWQNFIKRHGHTAIQLGSCQYIIKMDYQAIPVKESNWAKSKVDIAKEISDKASVEYGANPIFEKSKHMKTLCLTLHETPEREAACRKHFNERGINAEFDVNWRERFDKAMQDVPKDFDFLFMGHCCVADDKLKKHVKGDIWETKRPFCNHACVIAKKCLPFVIKTLSKKCWSPVDIQLVMEVFPHLKTFACVPRLAGQFQTVIRP